MSFTGLWKFEELRLANESGKASNELVECGTVGDNSKVYRYAFLVEGIPEAAYILYDEPAKRAFVSYKTEKQWVDGELLTAQTVALKMMGFK